MATATPSTATVDRIVDDWPTTSAGQLQQPGETAEKMREKYGEPDEATPSRLVWYDNGPWTRTEVYREGTEHRFPVPHLDHLYQYIDYQVPPEKHDVLARFDGSVHAHRTEGELVATCYREAANVLALNLAHDVVTEQKTVDEAREAYAEINAELMAGGEPEYVHDFRFPLPAGDQGDPDVTIVTDELRDHAGKLAVAALVVAGVFYALVRRQRESPVGGSRGHWTPADHSRDRSAPERPTE